MPFVLLLILLVMGHTVSTNSTKAEPLKFTKFVQNESNLPKSYKRIKNTFDDLDTKRIHSFSIEGGKCQTGSYGNGTSKGDCSFGSVRSMLRELDGKGRWDFSQPKEAWYGWDMMIPKEFPTRGEQTRGSFIFAQWKGDVCPHVALAHSTDPTDANQMYIRL